MHCMRANMFVFLLIIFLIPETSQSMDIFELNEWLYSRHLIRFYSSANKNTSCFERTSHYYFVMNRTCSQTMEIQGYRSFFGTHVSKCLISLIPGDFKIRKMVKINIFSKSLNLQRNYELSKIFLVILGGLSQIMISSYI